MMYVLSTWANAVVIMAVSAMLGIAACVGLAWFAAILLQITWTNDVKLAVAGVSVLAGAVGGVVVADAFLSDIRQTASSKAQDMANMLRECRRQFLFYEEQHRAKGTPEGSAKAEVNKALADKISSVLTTQPKDGDMS